MKTFLLLFDVCEIKMCARNSPVFVLWLKPLYIFSFFLNLFSEALLYENSHKILLFLLAMSDQKPTSLHRSHSDIANKLFFVYELVIREPKAARIFYLLDQ